MRNIIVDATMVFREILPVQMGNPENIFFACEKIQNNHHVIFIKKRYEEKKSRLDFLPTGITEFFCGIKFRVALPA